MIQMDLQVSEKQGVRQDTGLHPDSALRTLLAGIDQCRAALFGADSSAMLLVDSLSTLPSGKQRLASVIEVGSQTPTLSAWMFNQRPESVRIHHRERTDLDVTDMDSLLAGAGQAPLVLLVAPKQPVRSANNLLRRLFTLQMSDPAETTLQDSQLLALKKAFLSRLSASKRESAPRVVAAHWDSGSHSLEIIEG